MCFASIYDYCLWNITIYEDGMMNKEEADASVEDMGGFVDYMNSICDRCKHKNKDCECDSGSSK